LKAPPAKIAKQNSPLLREKTPIPKEKAVAPQELPAQKEPTREAARPPAREQIPDKAIIADGPADSQKLLPPVGWCEGGVGRLKGHQTIKRSAVRNLFCGIK
jgi:hypothetical protein